MADMYAQEFRVLETVNNIRIEPRGEAARGLPRERSKVIAVLRAQKTASTKTIRKALGLDKKEKKGFYSLNIERDENREINTDGSIVRSFMVYSRRRDGNQWINLNAIRLTALF